VYFLEQNLVENISTTAATTINALVHLITITTVYDDNDNDNNNDCLRRQRRQQQRLSTTTTTTTITRRQTRTTWMMTRRCRHRCQRQRWRCWASNDVDDVTLSRHRRRRPWHDVVVDDTTTFCHNDNISKSTTWCRRSCYVDPSPSFGVFGSSTAYCSGHLAVLFFSSIFFVGMFTWKKQVKFCHSKVNFCD